MSETPIAVPERTILEKIFLSRNEPRLKAGWRLSFHTILMFLLFIIAGIVAFMLLAFFKVDSSSDASLLAIQFVSLLVISAATFVARKFFDRRSIVSLGLKLNLQALYDLLAGIAITFLMMGLIYLIESALGWTKFKSFSWQTENGAAVATGLFVWLVIFLITGWQEELLARGYHLQNIADGLNLTWGVILSSLIFGFMHLGNPNSSLVAVAGIFLAGFFLALPYILTRQLWLSIGLHIGWNFFEGVVFGFPVSGLTTYSLIQHTVTGPELWTGGMFGPEAGLLLIPALVLGALLVYGYTRLPFRKAAL